MKSIFYSSPYIPAEWIAAHGFHPVRLQPSGPDRPGPVPVQEGVCPYMRAFCNEACADGSGILILTTACDQMRRAADFVAAYTTCLSFLFNMPASWETPEPWKLYLSELERLGRFLVESGGKSPPRPWLAEVMETFHSRRTELHAMRGHVTARSFSSAIACFHQTGCIPGIVPVRRRVRAVPLALLGGPLTARALLLFDSVERYGGDVVLDGTETGERTLPPPFDRRRMQEDPFLEMAECYFGRIPDAFRRPNSELFKWFQRKLDERGIRGVILVRHLWCDIWHAEVHRFREWLHIPLLDLDLNGEDPGSETDMRIQAFLEMLV